MGLCSKSKGEAFSFFKFQECWQIIKLRGQIAICCCPYNKHKWKVGQFSLDESFWMCPVLSRNSTYIRWGDLSRKHRSQSFFLLLGIWWWFIHCYKIFKHLVGIKLKLGIVERAPSKNFQFSRLLMYLENLLSWHPRILGCRWWEDYPLRKKTFMILGRANSPVKNSCPIHRPFARHDGLLPKGGNRKASFALFWANTLFNNLLIVPYNIAWQAVSTPFDIRRIRDTRKISLGVQYGFMHT